MRPMIDVQEYLPPDVTILCADVSYEEVHFQRQDVLLLMLVLQSFAAFRRKELLKGESAGLRAVDDASDPPSNHVGHIIPL